MWHGYSIQEGDKEKLLPSNSTRTVPAGECTHSQSGISLAYFLVGNDILRDSGYHMGRWRLYLMPSGLRPCRESGPWHGAGDVPLGLGRRVARAKFAKAARLWDSAYDGGVASVMLGRAPRAMPRKSRCAGQGCRVALVRGKEQLLFESSGRSPLNSF